MNGVSSPRVRRSATCTPSLAQGVTDQFYYFTGHNPPNLLCAPCGDPATRSKISPNSKSASRRGTHTVASVSGLVAEPSLSHESVEGHYYPCSISSAHRRGTPGAIQYGTLVSRYGRPRAPRKARIPAARGAPATRSEAYELRRRRKRHPNEAAAPRLAYAGAVAGLVLSRGVSAANAGEPSGQGRRMAAVFGPGPP